MKVVQRVLVSVLCLLVLASAASAALTRMTKEELHNFIQKRQPAAGVVSTPADFLKKLRALKGPVSQFPVLTISTDKAYGASLIESETLGMPFGIGVGELGDYVLINDAEYGEIWGYRNGDLRYLLTPPSADLGAGRMYGHYYFGDFAGNVFRLESDGSVTPLFTEIDTYGALVGSLAVEPTTGWLAFTVVFFSGGPSESALVVMDPANPGLGFLVDLYDDFSLGVAFKGNYLYLSLVFDSVIIRYNWKTGSGPFLFTDKVDWPGDIQFDAKGNLYVAGLMEGDIVRFNASATQRKKIAWGFQEPLSLGLDRKGDIFVTDVLAYEVWKIRKK